MTGRSASKWLGIVAGLLAVGTAGPGLVQARGGEPTGWRTPLDRAVAERGRNALLVEGFLKPEWSDAAYSTAGRQWEGTAPDPEKDPEGYAAAFRWACAVGLGPRG
jgi:hypothetical protein